MNAAAVSWFGRRTSASADWPVELLLESKRGAGQRVSVVIPARNEQATIAEIVRNIRVQLMERWPLVDEILVMDSLSEDSTALEAQAAGAQVYKVAEVVPDLGVAAGKGEALWKSLFVTTGDLLVFIDADLTEWGTHFVTGLLGPLLADDGTMLVKGFYDRVLDLGAGVSTEGGRVTELVARPLLALWHPQLSAVVQPLAGEWAVRRSLLERIAVPVGYGVEFASLLDTSTVHGIDAIAQVDLGRRAHRHQNLHDLAVMATELLAVGSRRFSGCPSHPVQLPRFDREHGWSVHDVPVDERPPAVSTAQYQLSAYAKRPAG